jgi:hypothetical protein
MGAVVFADAGRTPFGGNVAVAATLTMAATTAAAVLFSPDERSAGLIVVGGYAATVTGTRAGLITAGLGFLLFDGFPANRYGELTWGGTTIIWHLTIFALVVGLGVEQRWIRHARADMALGDELENREGVARWLT